MFIAKTELFSTIFNMADIKEGAAVLLNLL